MVSAVPGEGSGLVTEGPVTLAPATAATTEDLAMRLRLDTLAPVVMDRYVNAPERRMGLTRCGGFAGPCRRDVILTAATSSCS